jgi:hypothetical protein
MLAALVANVKKVRLFQLQLETIAIVSLDKFLKGDRLNPL